MSSQMSLWDIPSAISLQESADGRSPSRLQASRQTLPSGLAPAHASLSARQAMEKGLMTKDTFGQLSVGSSSSVDLQRSLESRLRQRLGGTGSPEYELTWKHWPMPAGEPICALRAAGHRTSVKGFIGWPTPMATERNSNLETMKKRRDFRLNNAGQRTVPLYLNEVARIAAGDIDLAAAAGWATPTTRGHKSGDTDLTNSLHRKDGKMRNDLLDYQAFLAGPDDTSPAQTEKRGGLNPAFSRWLMGYPPEWCDCAVTATPSSRKSRRNS